MTLPLLLDCRGQNLSSDRLARSDDFLYPTNARKFPIRLLELRTDDI